jgi:hypothetical protein
MKNLVKSDRCVGASVRQSLHVIVVSVLVRGLGEVDFLMFPGQLVLNKHRINLGVRTKLNLMKYVRDENVLQSQPVRPWGREVQGTLGGSCSWKQKGAWC